MFSVLVEVKKLKRLNRMKREVLISRTEQLDLKKVRVDLYRLINKLQKTVKVQNRLYSERLGLDKKDFKMFVNKVVKDIRSDKKYVKLQLENRELKNIIKQLKKEIK